MTAFAAHLDQYLGLRRALGHQLADAARLLPRFVAHLDAIGASNITVENALAWATQPEAEPWSSVWVRRMGAVRGFARYMSGIDPANEIPPLGLVSFRRRWRQPFIYSEADVLALMTEVPHLIPTPFRSATFRTMIGLLAATGMRVGEVIALSRADVDWAVGVITVRHTKFDKSRELPVDPTTLEALADYADLRDRLVPSPSSTTFFIAAKGTAIIYTDFSEKFRELVRASGVGAELSESAADPRLPTLVCCPDAHSLVSGGSGCGHAAAEAINLPGAPDARAHVLVSVGRPRAAVPCSKPTREEGSSMSRVAPTLQMFFTDRLTKQRQASPETVRAYRNAMVLLLRFAQERTGIAPSVLEWDHLDVNTVSAFLDHLEADRHNGARSRNARLAAIRSLFRFAALRHPEHAQLIAQVLAVPQKRSDKRQVSFLEPEEVNALLASPDLQRWEGRRDRAMIALDVQTGLRLSELTGLRCADVQLGPGRYVRCSGKGRKERCVPLTAANVEVLRCWLRERKGQPHDPLFPTRGGRRLSDDAVAARLACYKTLAAASCPSLGRKQLTPHVLRHTCAMNLLREGVDIAVIALWLGHADLRSTNAYLHADMSIKERALARTTSPSLRSSRFRPSDKLIAFLEGL